MNTVLQMIALVTVALAAAGATYLIKGPPERGVPCDEATLAPDEICLSRVLGEWGGDVVWIDARSRAEWSRETVAGALLWNLDQEENMADFEAAAAEALFDGRRVVVFCSSESCGVSRQVLGRVKALEFGNPCFLLHGGWRAIAGAGGNGPPLAPGKTR